MEFKDSLHTQDSYFSNPFEEVKQKESEAGQRVAEFQRLCYSVFHEGADGIKLWEYLKEQYLMQQQLDPMHPQSKELSLWWDGFKACLLGLYNHGLAHIKRVNGAK